MRTTGTCRNGLQIRQSVLDAELLDMLTAALAPDVIAEAIEVAVAELRAGQIARAVRRSTFTAELVAIGGRERRLLDALADGDTAAGVIRERLREDLARRDRLTTELADLDATSVADTEALLRTVSARAADLRTLLGRHVTQARQVVRQLLEGRLVCQPFEAPAGITAAAEMVSRLPSGAAEESTGAHQRPTGNSVTAARAASAVVRMPPRNSVTATRAASEAPVVWPLPGMINSVA